METQVTPQQIAEKVNEEITLIAQSQRVNEEIPQVRVTKNPPKIAAGRKGELARKAKRHIEHSRPIKTWALVGVVAIAAVWLFYKTGEEKTSPLMSQKVQLEVSPHIMLMTSPVTDGKTLVNATYNSAVVSGLVIGYACIAKMITKATPPKLDFNGNDIGMVILDIGLAMAKKDMLIKQGLIPEDIMK